jgi:hypothetical protein
MRTKPTTPALRQLLTNIKRNGVPYKDTGHPASNAPFENDIRDAVELGWIEKTTDVRFELTVTGKNALNGMH